MRKWLDELPRQDRRIVGHDIAKVPFGWPIRLPVSRPRGDGLREVRSTSPSRREARVLFGFHRGMSIALSAFFKKARATPADEWALARQRRKEPTT